MRIILLAALDEEADAFMPGGGTRLDDGWPQVRRIVHGGHRIWLATSGIRKVNITTAAARLHTLHDPGFPMTLGTAGHLWALHGRRFFFSRPAPAR